MLIHNAWDGWLLAMAAYVAVMSLVRLMLAKRDELARELDQQIAAEKLRLQIEAKKAAAAAAKEKKKQERKEFICFICGKAGHVAKNCLKRNKNEDKSNRMIKAIKETKPEDSKVIEAIIEVMDLSRGIKLILMDLLPHKHPKPEKNIQ